MFTFSDPPTLPPTKEQVQAEYIAQLENGSKEIDERFVQRKLWAAYLVTAMRNARTHAELLDLLRTATLGGYMGTRDPFSAETPRMAYDVADTRLANTFWTDGTTIVQFYQGKLAPNLNDPRFSIDLEQLGYVAVHRGEIPLEQARYVERHGIGLVSDDETISLVRAYHTASPRYIVASRFICGNCRYSTILKDYGDEFRATCDRGWPADFDANPPTCIWLEEVV